MSLRIRPLGIVTAVVLALTGWAPVQAGGLTARASLPQVLKSAKQWQADSILVHVSSTSVKPDGTAAEWKYSFYSPTTKNRCVVTAGSGVSVKEVRLGNYTEALGEFVDSDKAMEVAKKNGLKGDEPSMGVARPAGGSADSTYWLVTGGWKNGDTSITIEAKTGKFTHRAIIGVD